MPTYEYLCDNHGIVEIFHSIKEPARRHCPVQILSASENEHFCQKPIKRLISGGVGVIPDADKLWDKAPTPENPRGEKRSDLKKHEAFLIGVPPKDRDRFRDYHRGKGNPREM